MSKQLLRAEIYKQVLLRRALGRLQDLGAALRELCRVGFVLQGWVLSCSPPPVRVVEVVGVADDAEGVVEVVLDEAPAAAVRECALQVLGACSKHKMFPIPLKMPHQMWSL